MIFGRYLMMRSLRTGSFLVAYWIFLAVFYPSALHLKAEQYTPPQPIIPLKTYGSFYPLTSYVFRDPDMTGNQPGTLVLSVLNSQLELYRKWLTNGNSKGKIHDYRRKEYLRVMVHQAWYWNDQLRAETVDKREGAKIKARIGKIHNKIRAFGRILYKTTEDRKLRQWIKFQVSLLDYQYPDRRAQAVRWLRQLNPNYLTYNQKNLIRLAVSLWDSFSGEADAKVEAMNSLRRMQNHASNIQSLVVHLAISKLLSDQQGEAFSTRERHEFANHLKYVSSLCHSLPVGHRADLLSFSLGLWVRAADKKPDWNGPPFRMDCYKNLDEIKPLQERIALQSWAEGDLESAGETYEDLKRRERSDELRIHFSERVAEIRRLIYMKGGSPFAYQAYLKRAGAESHDGFFAVKILNLHFKLISHELQKALSLEKKGDLNAVSSLVSNYLKSQKYDFRSQRLQVMLADLFMKRSLFEKASEIYGNLYRHSEGKKRRQFLLREIIAQSHVAGWSTEDPWNLKIEKNTKLSREKLLRLYYTLMQHEKSLNWPVSRQVGLLEISLGRISKAQIVWENALRAFPKKRDAAKALGRLLTLSEAEKDWEKVEKLIYLGLEKSISPEERGKSYNLKNKLEVALYRNSLALRQEGKNEEAVKKLTTLVSVYDNSPSLSDYLYLLANSYRKIRLYERSLENLEKILALPADVRWYQEALIEVANFYTGLAEPEKSLLLYRMYLEKFPGDAKGNQIRLHMAEIFTGLSRYKEAYAILEKIEEESLEGKDYQYLKEKRYFLSKKLFSGSGMIKIAAKTLADPDAPSFLKIDSCRILSRFSYENRDEKGLIRLASTLKSFGQSRQVRDTVSYVKYLQVRLKEEKVIQSFKSVLTDDFGNILAFFEKSYRNIASEYRSLCLNRGGAYCVPGYQSLGLFNLKIVAFLGDVVPSQEMKEEEKVAFIQEQQSLKETLVREASLIRRDIKRYLPLGNTAPEATREALWSQGKDWNFRNGTDSGPGFMQITKDHLRRAREGSDKKL